VRLFIHWTLFLWLREQPAVLLLALAVVGALLMHAAIEAPLLRSLSASRPATNIIPSGRHRPG
jgi:hypothetical protein